MAAGVLALILPVAASLREFFPLCLVLPLQGSVTFLAFVPQLEALSESLTHSIPRSFLLVALSASAVGFADALWLCPERALSRFFASVSLLDPVALSPFLHRVFGARFAYAVGHLPMRLAPTISPYTRPGWSPPICRVTLELRSVFHIFLCDIPHVYMAIILSVSLTPACPYLVFTIGCCSLDT